MLIIDIYFISYWILQINKFYLKMFKPLKQIWNIKQVSYNDLVLALDLTVFSIKLILKK